MKKLMALILAAALSVSMFGCTSPAPAQSAAPANAGGASSAAASSDAASGGAASTTAASGKLVGISMPTKSLERWNRDGSYLQQQFKSKGCDVKLTYSDNKIDQQVKDIENLIAEKVSLLVVAAIDGESLSNVLNTAKSANIPVISYDRLIMNTDAISYYVSFDNFKVGQLQGQFVVDKL